MANALKCDRCHRYFDYDPSAKFNFIAFGHKDNIIGKNFPVKDICPNCMEMFIKWFENPDIKDLELVSKLKDAKIHIAQLKLKLGYTMSKEEMDVLEEEKQNEKNIL